MAKAVFFINKTEKLSNSGKKLHIRLTIQVGQNKRDKLLIDDLITYFNCGNIYDIQSKNYPMFFVSKFEDIYTKLILFFNKYPILGVKSLNFKDFKKAAELINNKEHLKEEAINKILLIKSKMNKERYYSQVSIV